MQRTPMQPSQRRRRRAIAGRACAALLLGVAVGGCQQAFASHEADVLHAPPPLLRTGQRAYWNDVGAHAFGMFELGSGLYRRGQQLCKIAEETVINSVANISATRAFLYCGGADGAWQVERGVVCRPVRGAASATCRIAGGTTYETLPPA